MEFNNDEIKLAYDSWQQSITLFNYAVTKEEVDFAVFNMEAKRKHYFNLLSEAKEGFEEKSE